MPLGSPTSTKSSPFLQAGSSTRAPNHQSKYRVPIIHKVLRLCSVGLGHDPWLFSNLFSYDFTNLCRKVWVFLNASFHRFFQAYFVSFWTYVSSQTVGHCSKRTFELSLHVLASSTCSLKSLPTIILLFVVSVMLLYHVALLSMSNIPTSCKAIVFSTQFTLGCCLLARRAGSQFVGGTLTVTIHELPTIHHIYWSLAHPFD